MSSPRGRRALELGPLVLSTTLQPPGAPWIDRAYSRGERGVYDCFALLLAPWRSGRGHDPLLALVVGWRRR